jgi:predicted DCC family thiol-disulfide oxidoreductase YuxK
MTDASTPSANHLPPGLAGFAARFPGFTARYLSLDPRSLGLARIYLALLLLADLVRRVPDLSVWYSNDGLLPNHTLLWRPGARYQFSFFFGASWTSEAAVLFLICGLVFFGLLIGYRTRLFHALSLICIVSLHDRVIFLENGGDVVLNILCAWTLFLPMGARFSVDALRASLRARREGTPAELERRDDLPRETRPVVSLAVLALLLQICVIYYFNAVHKSGSTWREGSAVHYALHQDRLVTWLGWQLRAHLTPALSQVMSYASLALEGLAPLLVLNPFAWRTSRRLAVILVTGLHVGFALLLNLGLFSFNMIGFLLLLIPDRDWDWLARPRGGRASTARRVVYDETSGPCVQLARLLVRLDRHGRLRLVARGQAAAENRDGPPLPDDLLVEDARTGRWLQGSRALAAALAAVPFAWPLALLLRTPLLGALLDRLYRAFAGRRHALFPGPGLSRAPAADGPATPVGLWLVRQRSRLREAAVVAVMLALGSQVLMENRGVPAWLKLGQAAWMRMVVEYPRLYQGWSMFAPNAPYDDHNVFVDAITEDGRHVDPLNERGSRVAPAPTDTIPEFLDQDEYFCDYMQRIPGQGAYHPPLSDWIQNYHRRTRRPGDRITSFEVYQITDQSPPPGQTQPTGVRKTLLFSWPSLTRTP